MVIFETIRWKNLLSYGNVWTEIPLNTTQTTILLGESGSGKSTLLDAIKFALYNKPYRKITKPQLVNTINNKECVVELEFSIGNKKYKIVRGIKPNIFEIYCNGTLVNQEANVKDYQVWLEKSVIGIDSHSFDQIVVLGAANFVPFMQLKPQERRTVIEQLLDIEIFGVMGGVLKEKVSKNKEKTSEISNNVEVLKEKIKIHEKYVTELESNKESAINDLKDKIKENESLMHGLTSEIQKLEVDISYQNGLLDGEQEILKKIQQINEIESKMKSNEKSLSKEIHFYTNNQNCPTCLQSIDDEFRKNELQVKSDKIEEIRQNSEKIEQKKKELLENNSVYSDVHEKIRVLKNEMTSKNNDVVSIQKFITKLNQDLSQLETPKKDINEERNQINLMQEEINSLVTEKEGLLIEKGLYEVANLLLKDNGIKSVVIKQYLPVMNQYVNTFLSKMNFFASFFIDENFNDVLKVRGCDDRGYFSLSEGEKQRVDLALLFTWRAISKMKNSVSTNLLIMDEVFDSYLDIEATENIIEMLYSPLFQDTNVVVISHKNTISDKFRRQLYFEKTKNFSNLKK